MDALEELRTTGLTRLEPMDFLSIASARAYLRSRPVYANAHVPQTARDRGGVLVPREQAAECEYVCAHTDDVILTPCLLECGLATIDIAAAYLGRDPPVGYSMNAFWTRPGPTVRADIQAFHRDADDTRFLAMFVYLSDVIHADDGPHDLEGPDGVIRTVYGHAGTTFLADTSHPHQGRKPRSGERGIAWFRWGVSERPPAGVWDKIQPIDASRLGARYPSEPRLREAIKLLAA